MALLLDETAGDLPVRDVGLTRAGLMPALPGPLILYSALKGEKHPQRLFRLPKEHLEDLCVKLQDENSTAAATRARRSRSTQEKTTDGVRVLVARLRQTHPGSSMKDRDLEDTVQELEARVALLETQKGALQNKLSLAKQHILDLGGRTPSKPNKGKSVEAEGGVRRATHTAPARCGPTTEDTSTELDRFLFPFLRKSFEGPQRCSAVEQLRIAELVQAAQALRDTLRDKEKEMEGTAREARKQQADKLRMSIQENIDSIRLQKQLSEKNVALAVLQERLNHLTESQRCLRESRAALLQRAEELTEQLKEERQRAAELEGLLTTSSMSLQGLDKLQERISDLEGERDLIKENYNSLLERSLAVPKEAEQERVDWAKMRELEERLGAEREERTGLELEIQKLRQEREASEETRNKQEHLEREVLRYKEQVWSLQDRLDSVTKEFDMSVEDLSQTLLQIKAFRMQQDSRAGLSFLDSKTEEPPEDAAGLRASHAETVLELQKSRQLLLLEHRIRRDLQDELKMVTQKMEKEREESQRRLAAKDELLSKRALHIHTLQAQLKEMAYNPWKSTPTVPTQYTWPAEARDATLGEDDTPFSQLRAGESLLEIHLKGATFTPAGLRLMRSVHPGGGDDGGDLLTFCTYSFLDFETHSTPVASQSQPRYSFTSRYALTRRHLRRLEAPGSGVRLELHQGLGGVRFVTRASGLIALRGTLERPGQRTAGRVSLSGPGGETVGVVDYWLRLFSPAEPTGAAAEDADRKSSGHGCPGWQDARTEVRGRERPEERDITRSVELYDYGGGIPNELVITLERCAGLSTRWPGLYPDAYLTYRFYDLPPHVSPTARCSADPVFHDAACFPLAVTADVLHYLRSSSLWVYVFDDSEEQSPPPYLAKTPVPLRALATGREVKGDYVLRDPAGSPRGVVRVMMAWRYPFQPSVTDRREERPGEREEASPKPVAKPRLKVPLKTAKIVCFPASASEKPPEFTTGATSEEEEGGRRLPPADQNVGCRPVQVAGKEGRLNDRLSPFRPSEAPPSRRSSGSDASGTAQDSAQREEEEEGKEVAEAEGDAQETSDSSDIIVSTKQLRPGDKLRVEILSLTFEPSSRVALDQSVQRVYVEYRLLGVPVETTETPMSLRKPTAGEEIHYNFTRVIYVDGSECASLRRYLFTMLEGSDPHQGRLKFTVVSEPMDEEEECVDVGHAFLDLKDLLPGNDVLEQQIDILSLDQDQEVVGSLKVSLEAAKALTGIYREFHRKSASQ
uniref:RPGR interacting protein 1 n=1 Tax=Tetraodon nigroviridis TaxID=99883 RepID=H3CNJ2_TETNG